MVNVATLRLGIDPTGAEAGARRFQVAAGKVAQSAKSAALNVQNLAAGFAAVAGVTSFVRRMAQFEQGIVGIGKTTGLAGDELRQLAGDIGELSTRVATSTATLLEIGQAAGQLGIQGSANILKFTDAVGKLTIAAPTLTGEEAALAIARLQNLTGEATSTVDQFASALVDLGNKTASTENEILRAATFIAQSTTAYKLSSAEVLGLAASVAELGQRAETAGSAIGRSFIAIDKAVRQGGEQLALFADIAGMSQEEFAKLYSSSALRGLQAFLAGLGRINDEGGSAVEALESVGLASTENIRVLQSLGTSYEILARDLGIANEAYDANTALNEEAEAAAQSLTARVTLLSNAFDNLTNATGEAGVLGVLKRTVDAFAEVINIVAGVEGSLGDASAEAQILAGLMAALAARGVIAAVGALAGAFTSLATSLSAAAAAGLTLQTAFIPLAGAVALIAMDLRSMTVEAANSAGAVKRLRDELDLLASGQSTRQKALTELLAFAEGRVGTGRPYVGRSALEDAGFDMSEFEALEIRGKTNENFATAESVVKRVKQEIADIAAAQDGVNQAVEQEVESRSRLLGLMDRLADVNWEHLNFKRELLQKSDDELEIVRSLVEGGQDAAAMTRKRIELERAGIDAASAEGRRILGQEQERLALARSITEAAEQKAEAEREAAQAAREYDAFIQSAIRKQELRKDRIDAGIAGMRGQMLAGEFEESLMGATADEYEKAWRIRELYIQQATLLQGADAQQTEQIMAYTAALVAQEEALQKLRDQRELMLEFQDAFVDGFADIITGAESAADAFEQFARRMLAAMTELILKKALMDAFFGIGVAGGDTGSGTDLSGAFSNTFGTQPSARGNIFSGAGQRFASGGIVGSPTSFLYAGGMGIMGEAGPEAIMPIGRDSRGNLGVKVADGGASRPNITVQMTVNAKDADSFRRSRGQIINDLERATTRLNRNTI